MLLVWALTVYTAVRVDAALYTAVGVVAALL